MHPKAVFLALHGFGLYRASKGEYRIKRNLHTAEAMLYFANGRWNEGNANAPSFYKEVPWDQMPQEMLGALPQEMSDNLLGE